MELGIAMWGAFVATALAARDIIDWRRDRVRLEVRMSVAGTSVTSSLDERDQRLVVVLDHHGIERGSFLSVGVANRGQRAVQIVSIYFSDGLLEQQVTPAGLPVVLESNTRVDMILQLEWIATHGANLVGLGVLDAIGRRHQVEPQVLEALVSAVASIQTRVGRYKRREGADLRMDEEVTAFQAFDPAVLIRHGSADMRSSRSSHGQDILRS